MSEQQDTAPEGATPETPETPSEKAKRTQDRRSTATRIFRHIKGSTWEMLPEKHAGITKAESWRDKNGSDGALYWVGDGPDEAHRVEPRKLVREVVP